MNKLADLPVVPITVPHPPPFQLVELDFGDGGTTTERLDLGGYQVHQSGVKPVPQWTPERLHDAVMEWVQAGTDNAVLDAVYEAVCDVAEGRLWVSRHWRWTGAGWRLVEV